MPDVFIQDLRRDCSCPFWRQAASLLTGCDGEQTSMLHQAHGGFIGLADAGVFRCFQWFLLESFVGEVDGVVVPAEAAVVLSVRKHRSAVLFCGSCLCMSCFKNVFEDFKVRAALQS